ncbi:hypothetical protein Tco_0745755 [Tanacetum coccineum]
MKPFDPNSAHVIKMRDMHERVLVLFGLSHVWKSHVCDLEEPHHDIWPNLQRLPFYGTPPAFIDAVIPDPTLEDLAVGTPSAKILAKAEVSLNNTTRPSLFMDNSDDESDDDGNACVEIPLVTPIRSAAVIPSSRELYCSHSRGKGIMFDDAAAPSAGLSRPRPSSSFVPSLRDVSGDAIHTDFFLFSAGHYYATYPKGGVAGNCEFTREEWDAPYQPTIRVLTNEVFKDPSICKTMMSVLHCIMMSHGGELLARYCGLLQSYHEYVFSVDSRLKGYEERIAGLTGLELQVSALKRLVSGINDKLSSSNASFAKSKAKGKERKKKIKSLTKSLDNLHAKGELISLAASVGFEGALSMHRTKDEFAAISEHVGEPLFVILQLEPEKLALSANVPASRDARVVPTSSVVASEQNEEWVNVMVDGPDPGMIDGATHAKSESAFVQGTSYVLDEVAEVTVVGSECVSSSPGDVVVALSVGEKVDGSLPSSATNEETIANPFRV